MRNTFSFSDFILQFIGLIGLVSWAPMPSDISEWGSGLCKCFSIPCSQQARMCGSWSEMVKTQMRYIQCQTHGKWAPWWCKTSVSLFVPCLLFLILGFWCVFFFRKALLYGLLKMGKKALSDPNALSCSLKVELGLENNLQEDEDPKGTIHLIKRTEKKRKCVGRNFV